MTTPRPIRIKLAAEAGVDISAVDRLLKGQAVRGATRTLVTDAARRLGLLHLIPNADTNRAA